VIVGEMVERGDGARTIYFGSLKRLSKIRVRLSCGAIKISCGCDGAIYTT
jgi:hypothetical protein